MHRLTTNYNRSFNSSTRTKYDYDRHDYATNRTRHTSSHHTPLQNNFLCIFFSGCIRQRFRHCIATRFCRLESFDALTAIKELDFFSFGRVHHFSIIPFLFPLYNAKSSRHILGHTSMVLDPTCRYPRSSCGAISFCFHKVLENIPVELLSASRLCLCGRFADPSISFLFIRQHDLIPVSTSGYLANFAAFIPLMID